MVMKFSTWFEERQRRVVPTAKKSPFDTELSRQEFWRSQLRKGVKRWNDVERKERRKNMTPEEVAQEEARIAKMKKWLKGKRP
jgi:hypothetical protein